MAAKGNYPYSIKQDFDGQGIHSEEEKSVARVSADDAKQVTRALEKDAAPQSQEDANKAWKRKVIDRLRDYNFTKEADYLDKNWGDDGSLSDDDAFSKVWSGEVWGGDKPYSNHVWGTTAHNPSSSYLAGAMEGNDAKGQHIKGKQRLMHDSSYQKITSVMRTHADGSVQTPNPIYDNYAVAKLANRLVKVQYDNGDTHWMPSDDTNKKSDISGAKGAVTSNAGELSDHAATAYGGSNVNMSYAGKLGSDPGYLTNGEWDEIGRYGYTNPDGTIPNNYKQLEAARKARGLDGPAPMPKIEGGGPLLLNGWWNVMHGADTRCVGYANPLSLHEAGGYMLFGSNSCFVGDGLFPVSRIGDGTSDGKNAVTGASDCCIGGAPTTQPGK